MSLDEMRQDPTYAAAGPPPQGWACVIVSSPALATDDVYVTIRGIDGGRYRPVPVTWAPIEGALPQSGDTGLVLFDEANSGYLVMWKAA